MLPRFYFQVQGFFTVNENGSHERYHFIGRALIGADTIKKRRGDFFFLHNNVVYLRADPVLRLE
jgi:hypothetical protein